MKAKSVVSVLEEGTAIDIPADFCDPSEREQTLFPGASSGDTSRPGRLRLVSARPSSWSRSLQKRLFDIAFILLFLPVLAPVLLILAFAVRLTSEGPVFFLQKRVGIDGRLFTILKFRTMVHVRRARHAAVTTTRNQRFTPIGPFLRRWKLDELPQILNVLKGDMSIVGPRPKLPDHQVALLQCAPGLTGAATLAFAREEALLSNLPKNQLDTFYRAIVLPLKQRLDDEYMARATFFTDLQLIADTALRKWDRSVQPCLPRLVCLAATWNCKARPTTARSERWQPLPSRQFPLKL